MGDCDTRPTTSRFLCMCALVSRTCTPVDQSVIRISRGVRQCFSTRRAPMDVVGHPALPWVRRQHFHQKTRNPIEQSRIPHDLRLSSHRHRLHPLPIASSISPSHGCLLWQCHNNLLPLIPHNRKNRVPQLRHVPKNAGIARRRATPLGTEERYPLPVQKRLLPFHSSGDSWY